MFYTVQYMETLFDTISVDILSFVKEVGLFSYNLNADFNIIIVLNFESVAL